MPGNVNAVIQRRDSSDGRRDTRTIAAPAGSDCCKVVQTVPETGSVGDSFARVARW